MVISSYISDFEAVLCLEVANRPEDKLSDFEWVEDFNVLVLVNAVTSSTVISIPCLKLKGRFSL